MASLFIKDDEGEYDYNGDVSVSVDASAGLEAIAALEYENVSINLTEYEVISLIASLSNVLDGVYNN